MTPDLTAIQARHVERTLYERKICRGCNDDYPCDTTRVLEEVERVEAEVRRLTTHTLDVRDKVFAAHERRIDELTTACHHAEADLARVRGVIEAARALQQVPAVLVVAESTVEFFEGKVTPVPVTQAYADEVWNQFIDALEKVKA